MEISSSSLTAQATSELRLLRRIDSLSHPGPVWVRASERRAQWLWQAFNMKPNNSFFPPPTPLFVCLNCTWMGPASEQQVAVEDHACTSCGWVIQSLNIWCCARVPRRCQTQNGYYLGFAHPSFFLKLLLIFIIFISFDFPGHLFFLSNSTLNYRAWGLHSLPTFGSRMKSGMKWGPLEKEKNPFITHN